MTARAAVRSSSAGETRGASVRDVRVDFGFGVIASNFGVGQAVWFLTDPGAGW